MEAQLIVTMVMWSGHTGGSLSPITVRKKKRRGLEIIVRTETMETSVAKGMALNSEVRI